MDAPHGCKLNVWAKSLTAITQDCCELYWTSSGGQHLTKQQPDGNLQPIMKTIQVRRTRHTGHCWRSKDELMSDVLLWTPLHGRAKVGRPPWTYIQQLCANRGCSLEDLPEAMDDRNGWRKRARKICAYSTTWKWWNLFWDTKKRNLLQLKRSISFYWKNTWSIFRNLQKISFDHIYIWGLFKNSKTVGKHLLTTLLINLRKLIQISVLISVQVNNC